MAKQNRHVDQLLSLGKAFRDRRIEKGLSQLQVELESGISSMTIMKLENGNLHNISLITVHKIAGALGMEMTLTVNAKK